MEILLDFAKRDASADMGKAIAFLWQFRRRENDTATEFARRFSELEQNDKSEYEKIDTARRTVHKFFLQLMQVKQAGLISERELIIGFYKHQLETVVELLEPLETKKVGYPYTKPVFREYRRLYTEYDRLYAKYLGTTEP
jgi:hypothetical protein